MLSTLGCIWFQANVKGKLCATHNHQRQWNCPKTLEYWTGRNPLVCSLYYNFLELSITFHDSPCISSHALAVGRKVVFSQYSLYTGSFIVIVWKFLLIAPKIWLPVTFLAYAKLTKCGQFDKQCLWSLGVTTLNHNSTKSREFL